MKMFGYIKKNNKFILTFKGKENLPFWLYLKISKDEFEQLAINFNAEIDLLGKIFFYSKDDIKCFIKELNKWRFVKK